MVSDDGAIVFITFLLAMVGYVGLTACALFTVRQRMPHPFWLAVVVVIVAHVLMVWAVRYHWSFALAVRNGYGGFLLFHGALVAILASTMVRDGVARILIRLAFLVVSAGAIGATFRYGVVALYRIPVLVLAASGAAGLLWAWLRPETAPVA